MTHQAKSKYATVVLLLIVFASFSTFVEGLDRGNLLKGIDISTVRREGIEPIERVYT